MGVAGEVMVSGCGRYVVASESAQNSTRADCR